MNRPRLVLASLLALCATALAIPIQAAPTLSPAAQSGPARPGDARLRASVTRTPGQEARPANLPVRHGPPQAAGHQGRKTPAPATAPAALAPVGQSAGGQGLGANGATPSDSTGAIGTNHYIEMVNNSVGMYDRTLANPPTSTVDLGVFVGATAGAEVGDPQVQWDEQAQRWLYVTLELYGCSTTCTDNKLAFGWSKGADISGLTLANAGWCNFHLDMGTNLFDYPKLGHDPSFMVVGANVFASNGTFSTASIVAIPMPAAGDATCAAPIATTFGSAPLPLKHGITGDLMFTPIPSNTADSSSTAYISAADFGGSSIGEWHVIPTTAVVCVSGPCLVHDGEIPITTWASGPEFQVPQPGGHQNVDALDGRLTQAVQHSDPSASGGEGVWTQHTTSSLSGRTVVTWFELLPGSCSAGTCSSAALRQEGTLSSASLYLFNAAISPTSQGNAAVIHYNTASASTFIDVRAQSRNAADPPGTMSGELVLKGGTAADTDFSCTSQGGPPCRWGDYSGASPDPTDCSTAWGTNMLIGSISTGNPTWVTHNFALHESALHTTVSTQQYGLTGSDGATWRLMDSTRLVVGAAPCAESTAIVSANADLFTNRSGVNQDIGLFVDTDGVSSTDPVAWKESGGSAGTFSPNAAYVQAVVPMHTGHSYVVRLKWKANVPTAGAIFAGAGPLPAGGGFSPTRLSVHLFSGAPQAPSTTVQQHLTGSDGTTWTAVPGISSLTLAPPSTSRAVIGGNADLFTDTAGYNQDLGILVSGGSFGGGQVVAWKESGGFAGTFSPNAAFVQTVLDLAGGIMYTAQLVWKTNRMAPANSTIYAGAGPLPGGAFSPTSLTAYMLPGSANPQVATTTGQPSNLNSDGSTWKPLGLQTASIASTLSTYAILGANADLFTNRTGFNQDLAIFVSVDGAPTAQLVAWKESGGFGGTFSPNAAFIMSAFPMVGGHSYVFSLRWKTNRSAVGTGSSIFAGAGPISNQYSPTLIEVETAS